MLKKSSCVSPLHCAGGHTGHDLLLRAEIQQHDRKRNDDHVGKDQIPVGAVRAEEIVDGERQRIVFGRV